MNPNKDPVMRKKLISMNEMIFNKCVNKTPNGVSNKLTDQEKKDIDRGVLKYLETAAYVRSTFQLSFNYIMHLQEQAASNQQGQPAN